MAEKDDARYEMQDARCELHDARCNALGQSGEFCALFTLIWLQDAVGRAVISVRQDAAGLSALLASFYVHLAREGLCEMQWKLSTCS